MGEVLRITPGSPGDRRIPRSYLVLAGCVVLVVLAVGCVGILAWISQERRMDDTDRAVASAVVSIQSSVDGMVSEVHSFDRQLATLTSQVNVLRDALKQERQDRVDDEQRYFRR